MNRLELQGLHKMLLGTSVALLVSVLHLSLHHCLELIDQPLQVNGTVATRLTNDSSSPVIIVGTIEHSSLLKDLVNAGKLDTSTVDGKWESYTSQVVQSPSAGIPWALVIAGSDRRGAIYGLYDVSEQMGVSPWYW